MPSDRKKKASAVKGKPKAATSKGKPEDEGSTQPDDADGDGTEADGTPMMSANASLAQLDALAAASKSMKELNVADTGRSCTGVLASHPQSRDVHVSSLTLLYFGHDLLVDADLEINYGRRYGLLGPNGCGKSTLLKALAGRDVPIPKHIDIYLLDREIAGSDMTALEAVMSVDEEKIRMEQEAEALAQLEMTEEVEQRLSDLYERLEALDSDLVEMRAASILHGLGFNKEMQLKKTREFSGGWRMRIALARALFIDPTMLLLDEPTNHLDLEACVWLEEHLKKFKRILLMVSHSQDFLNGVCTNIIHMQKKKLNYYSGNYDQFVQTRAELDENQMKKYKWEQEQISNMKEYIARFGHGSAKLARQAQSKEKTLAKMVRGGLTDKVEGDKVIRIRFQDVGKLPPPVLQFTEVAFGYSPDKVLYSHVDLGVDLDSRVAIVGPNGAGKSTLLKLMVGALEPLDGMVKRHNHLRIGQYHQHLTELLDPELTPLEYMVVPYFINDMRHLESGIRTSDQDRAVARHHSKVRDLIGQGERMLASVVPAVGMVEVESSSKAGTWHTACVADGTCTCPSAGRGRVCKHVEAAAGFALNAVATAATQAAQAVQEGKGDPAVAVAAAAEMRERALTAVFVSGANLLLSQPALILDAESGPTHNVYEFRSMTSVLAATGSFSPLVTDGVEPHCTCVAFEYCGLCSHVLAVAGYKWLRGHPDGLHAGDEALQGALLAAVPRLLDRHGGRLRGHDIARYTPRARNEGHLVRAAEVGGRDAELLLLLRGETQRFSGPAAWPSAPIAQSIACDNVRVADLLSDISQQALFVTDEDAALLDGIARRTRERAAAAATAVAAAPPPAAVPMARGAGGSGAYGGAVAAEQVPDASDNATTPTRPGRGVSARSGTGTPYSAGGLVPSPDAAPPGATRKGSHRKTRPLQPGRAKKAAGKQALVKVTAAGRPRQKRKGLGE